MEIDEKAIAAAAPFVEGEVYSEKSVEDFRQELRLLLRNRGYAFAQIEVTEQIDDERLLVNLDFDAIPDRLVEVRKIGFTGNSQTRDEVLRRQLEILEGEVFRKKSLTIR